MKDFVKKYGLFIFLLLILATLFLVYTSIAKKPSTTSYVPTPTPIGTNPTSSNKNKAPFLTAKPKDGMGSDERNMVLWTPQRFSARSFRSIHFTTTDLIDGSIQYTFPSDTPGRPKLLVVKNGITIFQRTPFYNISMGDPTKYGDPPEYMVHGSSFWGQNMMIYIFMSRGFAYVVDPNKKQVLEQMIFQPVSKDAFKKVYPTDIIGELEFYQH